MNEELDSPATPEEEDYSQYRALSMAAVVALVLGVVSLSSLLFVRLLFVPLLGVLFAVVALRNLNRHADELTGKGLARTGMILCLLAFFGGAVIAATKYALEVPEGYKRISFADLQPDPHYPDWPVPPSVLPLDGKKIYIKGYIYPGDRTSELKRFILVPDMLSCCFGGQPALTDMIEVTLRDPIRVRFSYRRRGLGGVFKVNKQLKELRSLTGVYYELDADYLQ